MSAGHICFRSISLFGPQRESAILEFVPGVNVVCGASETGKSFLVETLDFVLGGSEPLRDIPERVGFDRVALSVDTADDKTYTFERSIDGGNFRLFEGRNGNVNEDEAPTLLKAKHAHDREDTLSGWLLSRCGLSGKLIRKNAAGSTRSLSFRDLARLVVVQENEIIKQGSPFLSGQFVTKTSEFAALKLLLTGVDDSSLLADAATVVRRETTGSKVELVDQWLAELVADVDADGGDQKELTDQFSNLEFAIAEKRDSLQQLQAQLNDLLALRRIALEKKEAAKDRISEVGSLLARFELLDTHYRIDVERLLAIREAGSLFFHQEHTRCPLCGADPSVQHLDGGCDGDVEAVVAAASVELDKVHKLSAELVETIHDLDLEAIGLRSQLSILQEEYDQLDKRIREGISPDLGGLQTAFADLVEKKAVLRQKLDVFSRIERLEFQRRELLEMPATADPLEVPRADVSKSVLAELSMEIEKILKAWHFPDTGRVYFDEVAVDFVINGKPRGSRGKGLRAITHAAASIALMQYCMKRELPHPGFVILDSPLLAYWEPEGEEDDLKGTDLKEMFYNYLLALPKEGQVIIFENQHPPANVLSKLAVTVFTKNPASGRYGLFPPASAQA
jgi:hypothetical protein